MSEHGTRRGDDPRLLVNILGGRNVKTATLWINGNRCRIAIKEDGEVVMVDDTWNNRASAEMTVMTAMPEVKMTFVPFTDSEALVLLNREFDEYREDLYDDGHYTAQSDEEISQKAYPR